MCNATNDVEAIDHEPTVQFNWYNGTALIKPDGKHVMITNKQNSVTGQIHSVLTFDPVNYTNDGEYTCRAFNHPSSFTESRVKLTVECKLCSVGSC